MSFSRNLRQSVLQAAMQGKLTQQLPEDGDGVYLASEIKRERRALGNNEYVTDDWTDNEYPDSWGIIKSGECFALIKGKEVSGVNLPYLEAKYLRGKISPKMMQEGEMVLKGTKVILVDGENSGEVFTIPEDGILCSTFKVLFIPESVDENFALLFLNMNKDLFRNNKKGATIPHLNKEIFNDLEMPIPPLPEQKRIVERIEELMRGIDELEAIENELTALK